MKYSITNVFEDAKEKMCRKAPCDKKSMCHTSIGNNFFFFRMYNNGAYQ